MFKCAVLDITLGTSGESPPLPEREVHKFWASGQVTSFPGSIAPCEALPGSA